jgi:hypothetical protein
VNKYRLLCAASAWMMHEFNGQTLAALKHNAFFKLLLPPFSGFLLNNVQKEIQKDHAVIEVACQSSRQQLPPGDQEILGLLQMAREIDRRFVRKTHIPSIGIQIRHEEIETIRAERMRLLLDGLYQILRQWEKQPGLRKAVKAVLNRGQFHGLILKILFLYINETQLLSNSIKLPLTLRRARDSALRTVTAAMQGAATKVADECTAIMFGMGC